VNVNRPQTGSRLLLFDPGMITGSGEIVHTDISALIRCTVPVPTPSVVAILRIRYAVGVRLGQGPRRDAAFDDHGHLGDLTQRDRA
jgi:hypothetical protein